MCEVRVKSTWACPGTRFEWKKRAEVVCGGSCGYERFHRTWLFKSASSPSSTGVCSVGFCAGVFLFFPLLLIFGSFVASYLRNVFHCSKRFWKRFGKRFCTLRRKTILSTHIGHIGLGLIQNVTRYVLPRCASVRVCVHWPSCVLNNSATGQTEPDGWHNLVGTRAANI